MGSQTGILLQQLMRAHHSACMAALARRGVRDVGSPRLLWERSTYSDDPARAPTQKELADKLHSAPPTVAASLAAKTISRMSHMICIMDSVSNGICCTPFLLLGAV